MSEVVPGSKPSEIHPEAPAALGPNSRVTSENAPAKTFGTVLVQPEKPCIGAPTNSRITGTYGSWGDTPPMDVLLLKQQLGLVIKLFNYNELGFLWAVKPIVSAYVVGEPALEISYLFTDSWYGWQGSNLRPVAREAIRSLSTLSVSPTFSLLSS